jgi:hypothetical protein
MKNRKTDEEILEELWESIDTFVMKVVRTGTDETNFKILKMLPANIENMMKELNLTKVPVNNRVNILEKVVLVKRFRGTGNVVITDFGEFFLDKIYASEEIVRENYVGILRCIGQHDRKLENR